MKLLLKWLKVNKIYLNVAKTEIVIFKHHLKSIDFDFKIELDGKRLVFREYVNSNIRAASMPIFKDLGILPIPSCVFSLNIKLADKTLNLDTYLDSYELLCCCSHTYKILAVDLFILQEIL